MQVQDLMTRSPRTCTLQDTLNVAAQIFWECDCGCAPVLDGNGQVVGMLTDRDVCMAAYTQGKPLGEIPVPDAMGDSIVVCTPDATIATAENLMKENRVRRLPVIDDENGLVGVLSLNDIARQAARERAQKKRRRAVTDSEVSATLGEICTQRSEEPVAS